MLGYNEMNRRSKILTNYQMCWVPNTRSQKLLVTPKPLSVCLQWCFRWFRLSRANGSHVVSHPKWKKQCRQSQAVVENIRPVVIKSIAFHENRNVQSTISTPKCTAIVLIQITIELGQLGKAWWIRWLLASLANSSGLAVSTRSNSLCNLTRWKQYSIRVHLKMAIPKQSPNMATSKRDLQLVKLKQSKTINTVDSRGILTQNSVLPGSSSLGSELIWRFCPGVISLGQFTKFKNSSRVNFCICSDSGSFKFSFLFNVSQVLTIFCYSMLNIYPLGVCPSRRPIVMFLRNNLALRECLVWLKPSVMSVPNLFERRLAPPGWEKPFRLRTKPSQTQIFVCFLRVSSYQALIELFIRAFIIQLDQSFVQTVVTNVKWSQHNFTK